MRFSVAATMFAGVASAQYAQYSSSILWVTKEITVTSCAPTVTHCPARSTVVSTTSYLPTTSATSTVPVHSPSVPVYHNSTSVSPTIPASPVAPVPTPHVRILTISTCIPTFILKTITDEPTTTPAPTLPAPTNGTTPAPTGAGAHKPEFTGAASTLQISALAALAGLVAFLA